MLQRRALIDVLVTREDHIDTVAEQNRLQNPAVRLRSPAIASGRVQRVMQKDDLPVGV